MTIFIDYLLLIDIVKKLNLFITVLTNKLNLYFIYIREYLFRFLLMIYYKLGKANFILDTLLCLSIVDDIFPEFKKLDINKEKLDIFFVNNIFINEIIYETCYNEFRK